MKKNNSGRKKVADPKDQVCLYIHHSVMAIIGKTANLSKNREATREYLYHQLKVFEK